MTSLPFRTQREIVCGLALLYCSVATADSLRDSSYILATDSSGITRLFVFDNADPAVLIPALQSTAPTADRTESQRLLRSLRAADRVKGLTLLAGDSDEESLEIAITYLSDGSARVREEAAYIVADHPLASNALRAAYSDTEDE